MINFMRYGLMAVALTFILSAFAAPAANAQINDILKLMDEHYKRLVSLQSNIAREQFNAQLDETDKMSGTIAMLPGKGRDFSLRLEWTKPKSEIMTIVNGKSMAYIPGIKRAYTGTSDSKKVQEKGGNALKIMSMSKEEIKANYNVVYLGQESVSGGTPTFHLKLTPKVKSNDYQFADLWVDGNGMPIQGRITKLNKDTDTFLLTNLKKNATINRAIFSFELPKGTEVVPF